MNFLKYILIYLFSLQNTPLSQLHVTTTISTQLLFKYVDKTCIVKD